MLTKKIKKTIFFRVDGGNVWGISMGHIHRCLLLSKLLKNQYDIVFIMKNYIDGVNFVKNKNYKVITIEKEVNNTKTLIDLCNIYRPNTIIFDLYRIDDQKFFQYTRNNNIKTIVFDIIGKCNVVPDVLFNDSFVPEFLDYEKESKGMYFGPKYFIMQENIKTIQLNKKVNHIVITMGGSDPAGLTEKILSTIKLPKKVSATFVLGPSYNDSEKIINIIKIKENINVVKNPARFIDLLSDKDIVISAAGRTLYECAYLGRPVIIVPSIEHEYKTACEFSRLTGNTNVGLWDKNTPAQLNKAIEQYCDNYILRKKLFSNGREIVDGNGLARVDKIIRDIL